MKSRLFLLILKLIVQQVDASAQGQEACELFRVADNSATVTVVDLQSPNPDYVFNVGENSQIGTLYTLVTKGAEAGDGDAIRFDLLDDLDGRFALDGFSLILLSPFDLDVEGAATQYIVPIACSYSFDFGANYVQQLIYDGTLNILPVNDNDPVISPNPIGLQLLENREPDSLNPIFTFSVTDGDMAPEHQDSTMAFAGSDQGLAEELFALSDLEAQGENTWTGNIFLVGYLDYETKPKLNFEIEVINNEPGFNGEVLSSSVVVVIDIKDTDDRDPVFTSYIYNSFVDEGFVGVLTVEPALLAQDGDAFNYEVNYRFTDPIVSGFDIDASNAQITIVEALERDGASGVSSLTLTVEAFQLINSQRRASVPLVVYVQDVDDNPPVMSQSIYTASIPENSLDGTFVLQLSATDLDTGENAAFNFEIASLNGVGEIPFDLASTGTLTVSKQNMLDREVTSQFQFTVLARAMVDPSVTSSPSSVTVALLDENDNTPTFDQTSYLFQVSETASAPTVIGEVLATDADEGSNGVVIYSIIFVSDSGNALFDMEGNSVRLVQPIPSSFSGSAYQLIVQASDNPTSGNKRTSSVEVTVTVARVNDNAPQFISALYEFNVSENREVGSTIGTVYALDGDGDRIIYYTKPEVDSDAAIVLITVSNNEAILALADTLDTETKSLYSFRVYASDGNPDTEAEAEIQITVVDANDNAPIFSQSEYAFTVQEEQPIGTVVGQVEASDSDEGLNAAIRYSIVGTSDFTVDISTGLITTGRVLDWELIQSYVIVVKAEDSSLVSPRSANVKVTVVVSDINDNAPVFARKSYSAVIPENLIAANFLTVYATDRDDGANSLVGYKLKNDSTFPQLEDFVIINETSGQISLIQPFDREQIASFFFKVNAYNFEDYAEPTLNDPEATVTITIEDANDMAPRFSKQLYTTSVLESVPIGTIILQVSASDADSSDKFTTVFYAINGSDVSWFKMDPGTGRISVIAKLDAELTQNVSIQILAYNPDNLDMVTESKVEVFIVDSNDLPPQFGKSKYSTTVSEGSPVGTVIFPAGEIEAVDSDVSQLPVEYSLFDQLTIPISINDSTAEVYLSGVLDFENSGGRYEFVVIATDTTSPFLSSQALLEVFVTDSNDQAPVFSKDNYLFSVFENSPAGTLVGKLTASDGDSIELDFTLLVNSGDFYPFEIDISSGDITTTESIDRESFGSFTFEAIVSDGTSFMTSNVQVNILDLNDLYPQSPNTSYSFTIPELRPQGFVAGSIEGSDDDATAPNNLIGYKIVAGNIQSAFDIGTFSGVITVNNQDAVDILTHPQFDLTVQIYDLGDPSLSSLIHVAITLTDVNNNNPTFSQEVYEATIPEDLRVPSLVVEVSATDLDEAAVLKYTFVAPVPKFMINQSNGRVLVAGQLDAETEDKYEFEIQVDDGVHVAQTSVVVYISDVNDNSPVFVSNFSSVFVSETSEIGKVIAQIEAIDIDSDANGIIYSFSVGSSYFGINSNSGQVFVAQNLEARTVDVFQMTATALDITPPSNKVSNFHFKIYVNDSSISAPSFDTDLIELFVPEDSQIGTSVFKLNATDTDDGLGGAITYSIISQSDDAFVIVQSDLVLLRELNYEQQTSQTLVVEAKDLGEVPLSSQVVVEIKVENVNDNTPVILNLPQTTLYSKDLPYFYYRVMCIDDDINRQNPIGHISYELTNYINFFRINTTTGELSLSSEIPEEGTLSLQILCSDGEITTENSLEVLVLMQSDDYLIPNSEPISNQVVNLQENLKSVVQLFNFESIIDVPSNTEAVYSVQSCNFEYYARFLSLTTSGVLWATQALDKELLLQHERIILDVQINSILHPSKVTFYTIEIEVEDENDNAPEFEKLFYSIRFPSNTLRWSEVGRVVAFDQDSTSSLSYGFNKNESNENLIENLLEIDPGTGQLFLALDLELENTTAIENSWITYSVYAYDGVYISSIDVFVRIESFVDGGPVFSQSIYNLSLPENLSPGTKLLTFNVAHSPDLPIGFRIVSQPLPVFAVGVTTGVLRVSDDRNEAILFDHELLTTFELLVKVSQPDASPPRSVDIATVYISVIDLNDNSPTITVLNNNFVFEESERIEIPYEVTDQDSGINAEITLTITTDPPGVTSLISTDQNMLILEPVDYESLPVETQSGSLERYFQLLITISDRGRPVLSTVTEITVRVLDENDNSPYWTQFPDDNILSVSENFGSSETPVFTFVAVDDDSGSVVSYSIEGPLTDRFSIGNRTGQLYVLVPFDREKFQTTIDGDSLSLEVSASDGTNVLSTHLMIHLEDVNDEPPTFDDNTPAFIPIPDDKYYGSEIIDFDAFDPDEDPLINYRIISGSRGFFYINELSGVLYTYGGLMPGYQFSLVVSAFNPGKPSLFSIAEVQLSVYESQQEGLQFEGLPYLLYLPVEIPVGTDVFTVHVTATGTLVENIRYKLLENDYSLHFQIDSTRGVVSLTQSLTTLNTAVAMLVVEAFDFANPDSSILAELKVEVFNEPNQSPVFFREEYNVSLPDSAQGGMFVVQVYAADPDPGPYGQVRYRITSDNSSLFDIDENSGFVFLVNSTLDLEAGQSFSFEVVATDNGIPKLQASASVNVNILSSSLIKVAWFDPAVVFLNVTEDTPRGSVLAEMKVFSADPSDSFVYQIVRGNNQDLFYVDSNSGVVILKGQLDFDSGTENYEIVLMASFNETFIVSSVQAFASVIIQVLDVNDNQPVFDKVSYEFQVVENYFGSIGAVHATDSDSGVNSFIVYSISDNERFAIGETTGELFVVSPFDSDSQSQARQFRIIASAMNPIADENTTSSVEVPVMISLVDANDNAPTFNLSLFENLDIVLYSDLIVGTKILQLFASDEDEGSNAEILYEVVHNNAQSVYFAIPDPKSGWVSLNWNLPGVQLGEILQWQVEFEARDMGYPSLASSVMINFSVVHPEFEQPTFSPTTLDLTVRENVVQRSLAEIKAYDNIGEELRYFIISGNDAGNFKVNAITGILSLVKSIDKDSLESEAPSSDFTITIQATRMSDMLYWTNVAVSNVSSLPEDSYFLYEETNCDASSDGESCNTQEFVVLLQTKNTTEVISQSNYRRRRSLGSNFESGSNSNPSLLIVSVVVTDQNDNAPLFVQTEFNFMVTIRAPIGTVFGYVEAIDKDVTAHLTYSILGVEPKEVYGWFLIDASTGALSTDNLFHLHFGKQFSLLVRVTDGLNARTVFAKVAIASNEEVLFWEMNLAKEDLTSVSSNLLQYVTEETGLDVHISTIGHSLNSDKSLSFQRSYISFYAFNASYFVFPRRIKALLPSEQILEEHLESVLGSYSIEKTSEHLNLTTFHFKLDNDSAFWWINIEGIGIIYVAFAAAILIAEFTLFPYLLITNRPFPDGSSNESSHSEKQAETILEKSRMYSNGNAKAGSKVMPSNGNHILSSGGSFPSNGLTGKQSWKSLSTPGSRAREKLLQTLDYDSGMEGSFTGLVSRKTSFEDHHLEQIKRRSVSNSVKSSVKSQSSNAHIPITQSSAEQIADQILAQAKLSDVSTHL